MCSKREALLLCGGERCNVYLADADGELYMLDPRDPSRHVAHSPESVAAAAVRPITLYPFIHLYTPFIHLLYTFLVVHTPM